MKFPKRIKHRGRVFATIYAKTKARRSYRVAWQVAGRRQMASFPSYSLAKRHADGLVKDLAKGSQVTALNPAQARDALAALERLTDFYRATGRRVSLLAGISEFVEASAKLNGRTLGEAVDGYQRNVANVKRKDISEAVEEFIAVRKPLTEAKAGKRAQLSKNYAYSVGLWLRDFAKTFPASAVCDLGKEHLNLFMQKSAVQSPKSRNHYRGAVKMFLKWCIKRDYLSPAHRLFEADSMATEAADTPEGVRLRCEPDEYRRELVASVRGAERKPWFKSAAEKWIRWTRHKEFSHAALPHEKILFAVRRHCAEAKSREFFIGARDAGLVAGVSYITAWRMLKKLCADGHLEKIGERRQPRHAQTYRLIDRKTFDHENTRTIRNPPRPAARLRQRHAVAN